MDRTGASKGGSPLSRIRLFLVRVSRWLDCSQERDLKGFLGSYGIKAADVGKLSRATFVGERMKCYSA